MIPYTGWGCPTCEVGNPATRKRCKKCGRKRPDKYELKTFHRPPRINKPRPKAKGKTYTPTGVRHGRLLSKSRMIQYIPKVTPVETKLAAKYSDGAMAELQTDGSVTCTCEEFQKTNGCRHKAGIEEFVRYHPPVRKEA